MYVSVSHANYLEKSVANAIHEHLNAVKINYDDRSKMSKSTPINIKQLRSQKNNENNLPPQITCVEAICDIVVEQLPDLWRLGQSYFTGQLHVAVDAEKQSLFKVCIASILFPIIKQKINTYVYLMPKLTINYFFLTEFSLIEYAARYGGHEKYVQS